MGLSADARCPACGYHDHFLLGGGMRNFATFAAWPVWCSGCDRLATANHKEASFRCEGCGGIEARRADNPDVWQGDGKTILAWQGLALTDGHYRCPRCDGFTLRFARGHVLWD